jgi:hypothetical protein
MISAAKAKKIILDRSQPRSGVPTMDDLAITTCELSERGDYWIIRGNRVGYVVYGLQEYLAVGLNAWLVDVETGEVDGVGSGQDLDDYLQDKYDLAEAAGGHYTIEPAFDRGDKAAVIRLRQLLDCPIQSAVRLTLPDDRCWLTGSLRVLKLVQMQLEGKGVSTRIALRADPAGAVHLRYQYWNLVEPALKQRVAALAPTVAP